MPDTITVRSLTVFEDSATGKWVNPGDEIEATEARAAELMANGLVEKATRAKPAAEPAKTVAVEPRKGRG